jgi:RNA polymerase sigma-70 factor (ECF subfamily)
MLASFDDAEDAVQETLLRANRMPTAASYFRRPGTTTFRAFKLDVLRIEGGAIVEITTFGRSMFPAFRLSPTV